ncbi:MAG: hypothetical protein M0R49_03655 [Limnochordia bacterium]|jgi:hypothetical protein|nr:hypothetical protein [Limnochordia bacterium]
MRMIATDCLFWEVKEQCTRKRGDSAYPVITRVWYALSGCFSARKVIAPDVRYTWIGCRKKATVR